MYELNLRDRTTRRSLCQCSRLLQGRKNGLWVNHWQPHGSPYAAHDEYANRIPNPDTRLSTPRLRYQVPKINKVSAEQLHRAILPLLLPYKKPCCCWPPRVCCHTLTTDWLPVPLRTRHSWIDQSHDTRGKQRESRMAPGPEFDHWWSTLLTSINTALPNPKKPIPVNPGVQQGKEYTVLRKASMQLCTDQQF